MDEVTEKVKYMSKTDMRLQDPPKTDQEWRETLAPEQYYILRERGTERPFSGEYLNEERPGDYHCAGCNTLLFKAHTKFNAGCGWPSFSAAEDGKIRYISDHSHGMVRTEIRCAHCDGHLGHVFADGPAPTGQRYCVNSLALSFTAFNQE